MPKQNSVSQDRLKELLKYDPETGEFTWRVNQGSRAVASARAGGLGVAGYVYIGVDGARYRAHRLAWLYVHGVWPPAEVDHINGIPSDNRIVNLRCAMRAENAQNQRCSRRGSELGVLGVSRNRDKFRACIRIAGVPTHLGTFPTVEEAAQAYIEAKNKYHPFSPFANVS